MYMYIYKQNIRVHIIQNIYIYVWRMGLIGEFHELSLSIDVLYIPYGIQYSWETIRYSLFWLCNILDHFLCHCGFDNLEPLVPTLQHLVTPSLAKAFEQFAGTTGRPVDLSLRAKAEFECDLYVKAPEKRREMCG